MKMGANLLLSCLHSFSTVVLCFFFKHSRQGHSGLKSTVYKSSFHNEQILALQKRTISFTHPLALSHVLSLLWRTLETARKRRWGHWKRRLCHQNSNEKCDDVKKNSMMPTGNDDAASSQLENLTLGSTKSHLRKHGAANGRGERTSAWKAAWQGTCC